MSSKIFANTDTYGNIYYTLNGKLHREDGPAVINKNGDQFYYQNGIPHREDGPAYICICEKSTILKWIVNGKTIPCNSQEEFEQLMKMKAFW